MIFAPLFACYLKGWYTCKCKKDKDKKLEKKKKRMIKAKSDDPRNKGSLINLIDSDIS